eukprot:TRINITY_DN16663_c0_g1_i1.p1 TRINITY_DN16663_c0_g1~~TRINITY_DN16663_c0_g1_i1.p1  ORF type:complete len:132 (+),score=3.20 TRINITY_DN16663_c0_g1_i1:183-578(+)
MSHHPLEGRWSSTSHVTSAPLITKRVQVFVSLTLIKELKTHLKKIRPLKSLCRCDELMRKVDPGSLMDQMTDEQQNAVIDQVRQAYATSNWREISDSLLRASLFLTGCDPDSDLFKFIIRVIDPLAQCANR